VAVPASALISTIRDQLQDTDAGAYRWSDATLLRYLSEGEREVVSWRADANTIEALHVVSNTNPRRACPADSISLVTVVCNATSDNSRGGAIRRILADILDAVDPKWRSATAPTSRDADAFYDGYVHDPREPNVFWLYPRPQSGQNVYLTYVQQPAQLTLTSSDMNINQQYHVAVTEWALFRALSSEGRYSQPAIGKQHFELFASTLKLNQQEYRTLVRRSADVEKGP
jgi:hypothetical protein